MASILQNVFSRALYTIKDNQQIKSLASHASLYMGIVIYTAIGAKVIIFTAIGAKVIIYLAIGAKVIINLGAK